MSRTVAFALLVLGAVAVIATASVPWYSVDTHTRFSGTAITGGIAQATGVAVLAGALLMITLRSVGRRIVAVVVGLISLYAVIFLPWRKPDSQQVFAELRKHSLVDSYALHVTGGHIAFAISWLLVLTGVVLVMLYARRWPQRVSRFDRRTDSGELPTGPDGEPDAGAIWKAIDAGEDPTDPSPDGDLDRGSRQG